MWGSDSQGVIDGQVVLLKAVHDAGLEIADESLNAISERIGLQLQRSNVPLQPAQFGVPRTFSMSDVQARRLPSHLDSIAYAGAPELARALRGSLAPIVRIIRESKSARECETRLRVFCVGWEPDRITALISDALGSYAANGSVLNRNN
jgi:hypothetical protein